MSIGRKDDHGKDRWDLLPWSATQAVVRVLTFGATKYGDNNWRHVESGRSRYVAAALRHLVAWCLGQSTDEDTGQNHLAHAVCCLMFLLELDLTRPPDAPGT